MAKPKLIMALAKVLIAAAWADGKVSNEEVNSLKDLLFHLPGMTARDWSELEIYMETPVGPDERARLVADLQDVLRTPRERDLAVSALESLVEADGSTSARERAVFEEVRNALHQVDVSLFGQLGRLVSGPIQRRADVAGHAPNREHFLEDFVKNRIFYKLRMRLHADDLDLDQPEADLRKLSLAGGLMARVAYVDREVTEGEFETMVTAIQDHWEIPRQQASLLAEVAVSTISRDMDYYRLSREFFEATTEDDRLHFVEVLFAVAAGDGLVSHAEMEEIRTISTVLKLTHQQYIDAKLTVPREQRAY